MDNTQSITIVVVVLEALIAKGWYMRVWWQSHKFIYLFTLLELCIKTSYSDCVELGIRVGKVLKGKVRIGGRNGFSHG